jgi:hypothetical protein
MKPKDSEFCSFSTVALLAGEKRCTVYGPDSEKRFVDEV